MTLPRRPLVAGLLALPAIARAQDAPWPTRPIRMIVNFPPGGTTDIAGRIFAERLQARLGQPVPVENRAGATGNIGAEAVARAAPDGYTVLTTAVSPAAINYALFGARMPYRPEDLAAVGLYLRVPNVIMVHPAQPMRTIQDLVEAARARPGALNYGSAGSGGSPHMSMEMFKLRAGGLQITHVPFRGAGPMLIEAVGGRLEVSVDNIPSSLGHIREGRLRALAVTGHVRSAVLPDVPTLAETVLPGFEATAWFGMQAPARTPRAIIERLGAEIDAIGKEPEVRARLAALGADPPNLTPDGGTSPAAFEAFIKAEIEKWAEVVRASGARID
ncbi:tripartite tricarboxylate transporter substrate binding protein [Roseomonas alkaliterrae]|uniref:Tripartite-type tricarboxylate transporter receptor subunit TctC n=1 Tax=Neoroseomonas alkaliterrae TaxID=1452450 RepID=A0A840XLE9_9PROT|nr:tripartite tricarboxylate transporter substrate binding protein [Neoroseomonas alkaliterrae]MBB5689435.1 tripartite-type tricarboxylate transporter receptor subunit TctC [Neoroseomonas alkaliterrae]MBR0676873.1 tripartite tricarboxylate transporter substrate binding protein [Neoroseomonas alkaliterrae]